MKTSKLSVFLVCLFFILCFFFSQESVLLSKNMCTTFLKNIFPTLFPFFICTYLLLETNILEIIAYLFQYISIPLFKLSGYSCLIILVSIITGTPFAASLITSLFLKKKLSKKETFILSSSLVYPSWSFMYVTIGSFIGFKNAKIISLSVYLSSLLLLIILAILILEKPKYIKYKTLKENLKTSFNNFHFAKTLKKTIINSFTNLVVILGTMIYFSLPLTLINKIFKKGILLQSLIEFSSASFAIINSTISNKIPYLLLTYSFGSFSLLLQHFSMLEETKFKFKYLITGRVFVVSYSFIFLSLLT